MIKNHSRSNNIFNFKCIDGIFNSYDINYWSNDSQSAPPPVHSLLFHFNLLTLSNFWLVAVIVLKALLQSHNRLLLRRATMAFTSQIVCDSIIVILWLFAIYIRTILNYIPLVSFLLLLLLLLLHIHTRLFRRSSTGEDLLQQGLRCEPRRRRRRSRRTCLHGLLDRWLLDRSRLRLHLRM